MLQKVSINSTYVVANAEMKYPCVSDNYIGTGRHYLLLACKYLITAHCSLFVYSFMMSYTFVVPSHTVKVNNEAFLTSSIVYTIMLDTSRVHNILFSVDLCLSYDALTAGLEKNLERFSKDGG